jgi:hypothetical protein
MCTVLLQCTCLFSHCCFRVTGIDPVPAVPCLLSTNSCLCAPPPAKRPSACRRPLSVGCSPATAPCFLNWLHHIHTLTSLPLLCYFCLCFSSHSAPPPKPKRPSSAFIFWSKAQSPIIRAAHKDWGPWTVFVNSKLSREEHCIAQRDV